MFLRVYCNQRDPASSDLTELTSPHLSSPPDSLLEQENPVNIVEAHLLDCRYVGDFYGEQIRLSLTGFIRPEQKFASLAELIAQIQNDIDVTRLALDENNLTNAAVNARRVSDQFLMATEWENETVWATAPISNELYTK